MKYEEALDGAFYVHFAFRQSLTISLIVSCLGVKKLAS